MSRRRVCDASSLVALLSDTTSVGRWCALELSGRALSAPWIAAFETANVIRRSESAGLMSAQDAADAHQQLRELPVDWWGYSALADRTWSLRHNVTTYDASHVALAEMLDAPLVTLDRRLARAPGIRCEVLTPGG